MKDDEYKGYYCLLIAILCNLNAAEASTMYEYGPDHPLYSGSVVKTKN